MSKVKMKNIWTKYYSIIISIIALLMYLLYIYKVNGKASWKWIVDSEGFGEMCKAIAQFSSIVLGIYGFFIPVVMGKKDRFSEYFWNNINRIAFAKDVRKIIISGIFTILISSILLINDVLPNIILIILIGLMIFCLTYYSCCTYRFLNIFINIIIGRRGESEQDNIEFAETISEYDKEKLNEVLEKF